VICGMQTEFCVDTNVKVASELGYNVLIPREGTSTFDTRQFLARDLIVYYETHIWGDELAQVVPIGELLASVQS
jgi:nicotinamidase-related amidase